MRRPGVFVAGLLMLCGVLLTVSVSVLAQAPAPWTVLFDGRSLDRFTPLGTANWKLADGVVEASTGSGYLVTKQSYGDFEMRVEFWVTPDANSGVFIRCSNTQEITATNAYELNIFDMRPDQTYRTGAIVNVGKAMATVTTGGKWNTMEIVARGPRMTVTVNGTLVADAEDAKFTRGPIALQYGAGTVRFRKVEIR